MNKVTSEATACLTAEAIFDSISDAVIAVNAEKRVLWLNQAAEKLTGLPRTVAVGRSCSAVIRSSVCGNDCAFQRSLKTGKSIIDMPAFINIGADRNPVSISLALMSDSNGHMIGAVETVRKLSFNVAQRNQESVEALTVTLLASRSPSMKKVLDQLPTIAAYPSTVLIVGETGTGKELVARTIHMLSPRRHGPFWAVNCGSLPDTLLASELFGYRQGAFTDAKKDKPGYFALAEGGTLFLDDAEVMSLAMQAHLLRALQEKAYRPLGATETENTDARVILASNENLMEMVSKGNFRKDLYYRINVARLELPPLRRRKEDLPFIAEQILERFNRLQNRSIQGIEHEALASLTAYDWPGNVRELLNALEYAYITCKDRIISTEHLPPELTTQRASSCSDSELQDSGFQIIWAVLVRNSFNRAAAAKELGIAKTTLLRRMKKLGIRTVKDGRNKPIP